jgi:hypothetical protein
VTAAHGHPVSCAAASSVATRKSLRHGMPRPLLHSEHQRTHTGRLPGRGRALEGTARSSLISHLPDAASHVEWRPALKSDAVRCACSSRFDGPTGQAGQSQGVVRGPRRASASRLPAACGRSRAAREQCRGPGGQTRGACLELAAGAGAQPRGERRKERLDALRRERTDLRRQLRRGRRARRLRQARHRKVHRRRLQHHRRQQPGCAGGRRRRGRRRNSALRRRERERGERAGRQQAPARGLGGAGERGARQAGAGAGGSRVV